MNTDNTNAALHRVNLPRAGVNAYDLLCLLAGANPEAFKETLQDLKLMQRDLTKELEGASDSYAADVCAALHKQASVIAAMGDIAKDYY